MGHSEYLDLFRKLIAISSKRAELFDADEFDYNDLFEWREVYANMSDEDTKKSIDVCSRKIKTIVESSHVDVLKIVAMAADIGYDFLHYKQPDDFYKKYSGAKIMEKYLKKKFYSRDTTKESFIFYIIYVSSYWLHEYLTACLEVLEIEL